MVCTIWSVSALTLKSKLKDGLTVLSSVARASLGIATSWKREVSSPSRRTSETAPLEVPSPEFHFLFVSLTLSQFFSRDNFLFDFGGISPMSLTNGKRQRTRRRWTVTANTRYNSLTISGTSRNVNVASPACPQICPKVKLNLCYNLECTSYDTVKPQISIASERLKP